MTKSARQIAKDWRQCPTMRGVIEAQILADNRGDEFAMSRDGNLIARITNGDWDRIVRSGGGAFKPASLRREDEANALRRPSLLRAGEMRETLQTRKAA